MGVVSASPGTALIGGGVVLVLYLLYRAALPRPFPDIPYNRGAASKLFGDVPELIRYVLRTKLIYVSYWSLSHWRRHGLG